MGKNFKKICPESVDEYKPHSLFKLISIAYWVGIFSPIAHRQLKEKFGYQIAYVDTMAGCGVTSTSRERSVDFFCGSCPGALLSASIRKFPFDLVFAVEIDSQKGIALQKRLETLLPQQNVTVFNKDIADVSQEIAQKLQYHTISYVVIDPQAFQGMTWAGISPLLNCKGDAMVTWFEAECWRIKCSAIAQNEHQAAEASGERLTEFFGTEQWKNAQSPEELTTLFVERVLCDCGKTAFAKIKIPRSDGGYYWMILFTGKFPKAANLVDEWKKHMEKRINSAHGQDIAVLLDVKAGRTLTLKNWIKTE
jgi:three-Cys-motif partner protein